jgi:hypothetical protein
LDDDGQKYPPTRSAKLAIFTAKLAGSFRDEVDRIAVAIAGGMRSDILRIERAGL